MNEMHLDEFINQSLVNIANGIHTANETLKKDGMTYKMTSGDHIVSFDIAVTVSESGKNEAGAKASISVIGAMLGAGAKVTGENNNQTISRIKFSVKPNTHIH
jgi:hypothetical protein